MQPTAGFMTHVTCRLTAKNRDQLRSPTLNNRVWATFTFLYTEQVKYTDKTDYRQTDLQQTGNVWNESHTGKMHGLIQVSCDGRDVLRAVRHDRKYVITYASTLSRCMPVIDALTSSALSHSTAPKSSAHSLSQQWTASNPLLATSIHRVTVTVISMPAGFRRHLVGKTLRNDFHCDSAEIRFVSTLVIV